MKNRHHDGLPYIPDHLKADWDAATEELRQASEELHDAQTRHHKAVLARIAIVRMINGEEHR